jgi:zinc protease
VVVIGVDACGFPVLSAGRWRDLDVIDLQLQLITPAQVQAVAKKYFTPESLIGATLDPQPIDPNAKPKAAPKGLRHDS